MNSYEKQKSPFSVSFLQKTSSEVLLPKLFSGRVFEKVFGYGRPGTDQNRAFHEMEGYSLSEMNSKEEEPSHTLRSGTSLPIPSETRARNWKDPGGDNRIWRSCDQAARSTRPQFRRHNTTSGANEREEGTSDWTGTVPKQNTWGQCYEGSAPSLTETQPGNLTEAETTVPQNQRLQCAQRSEPGQS